MKKRSLTTATILLSFLASGQVFAADEDPATQGDLAAVKSIADSAQQLAQSHETRISEIDTKASGKASAEEVKTALATKANQSRVNELAGDIRTVQGDVRALSTDLYKKISALDDKTSKKADSEQVSEALSKKADLTRVNELVADINTVKATADQNKLDIASLEERKADKADLDAKADVEELNELAEAYEETVGVVDQHSAAIDALNTHINDNRTAINSLTDRVTDIDNDLAGKADAQELDALAEAHAAVVETVDQHTDAISDLDTRINDNATAINNLTDRVTDIDNDLAGTKVKVKELAKVTQTALSDLATAVDTQKADKTALEATETKAEANKQAIAGLDTRVSDNETALNNKADKTALEATETKAEANKQAIAGLDTRVSDNEIALNNKADKTALEATETKAEANKQAIAGLGTRVSDNETALNNKADKTALEATETKAEANKQAIAGLGTRVSDNETALNNKADKTELAQTNEKVATLESSKANVDYVNTKLNEKQVAIGKNKADIATLASKKADKTYVNTELAKKQDKIDANANSISANRGTIQANTANIAVNSKAIAKNAADIKNLGKRVDDLDKKVKKGFAAQAALTGLFQPYRVGRVNVSAAIGGYKSESALAVGAGVRFNENLAAKAGVAVGLGSGGSAAYNVGVNYEF